MLTAIVCVLLTPAYVLADAVAFGRVNINVNASGVSDSGGVNDSDSDRFNAWGTRLGGKGAIYLDEFVEGSYIVEVERPVFDNGSQLDVRQAWFGLRGNFGELRLGRHLGPSRIALDPIDRFESQAADQNAVLESEVLHDKSIAYLNRFNGIGYALLLSRDDGYDRISADMLANYNTERWYLAAAYLNGGDRRNTLRLGAAYRFPEGHRLGAALERLDDTAGDSGHDAYVFSAGYRLGKTLLKAQLGANKPDAGGHTEKLLGLGVDYGAWKATTLKAQYLINTHRDHSADDEERIFSLGISYQF